MLTELKAIHTELRETIADLAAALAPELPDEGTVSALRLKLTRLSSRRREMIECSIFPLLHDAAAGDTAKIADLRLETSKLFVASSEHIGHWTMRAIRADWAAYKRASAAMRASMLKRIDREAAILYPLLEAKANQRAA